MSTTITDQSPDITVHEFAVTISSIPAVSCNLGTIQAPIYNAHGQTIQMAPVSAPTPFIVDGNFRSTLSAPVAILSSHSSPISGAVPAYFFNSSGQDVRPVMGRILPSSISGFRPPVGNPQFLGQNRDFSSSMVKSTPPMPESTRIGPGSGLPSPSLIHGGATACDSRVNSGRVKSHELGELTRQSTIVLERSNQNLSNLHLVGKISGNRSLVPNSGISSAFSKLGLVRSFDLKFMPRGFLVLTLACEEDYAFFWTKGIMQVGPLSIRFSKWTPEFNLQEESPIAPVWIRFPGLPLHLFSKQSLFALAKIVGKPVKMDDHTADSSRGAFARVCVELNVLETPVKEIWVGWGDHAQEIEVIYERIPGYCTDCKMLGHSTSVCYSHGKNPKPVRPKPADRAPGQSPISTEPAPPGGVAPGFNLGTQPQLQKTGTGPRRRGRKRPVRQVLPKKNPLELNPFEVLSHGQDAEPDPVGLDCVDTDPPCDNLEDAGVGTSGKDQLESVLVEGVILSDEVMMEGYSWVIVWMVLGSHSIPSVPLSPDDASSAVEELVARQGPSVSELVFRLESAGDTDQNLIGIQSRVMALGMKVVFWMLIWGILRKERRMLFIGRCDYIERRQLWTSLLQVKPDQGPWLVGGDFNVVRNSSECLGSSGGRLLPMEEFNHFILDSGLVDAGFEGSSFTWTNKTIWKRLDRVFVSVDWGDHFHSIRVEHLIRTVSDHCPLFVSVPIFASGPSSFRFQSMWLRHHGFLQTVRLNWNLPCHLNGMHRLFVKLKRLKSHLKWWNKSVFGDLFVKLAEAEQAVRVAEAVCEADPSDLHWTSLSNCNEDLARVTAMEADFWRQKAACRWLEDGERNTKLFHNMVKKKRVANKIFRIWDNGSCLTSPDLIQQSGAAFFQNLLTGDPFVLSCPDFSDFPLVISDLENANIAAPPSLEEVRATVFSIHRDSVAGPDGFSSAFFQHCWEIVHQDVLDAVLDFFRGSPMPQGFTATTITLIPKVMGAQAWSDFRPISLCNVTNKIISKLLYSRLKVVAERLVSWNQSGFVPGRVISDNILLAQELTHSLSLPTRGGNVILKLDMAKAYDRVQWSFLLDVLRHYGFSEQVVSLISACISHCQFSVNINGSLTGFFGSTRGLRQGDPLSPLLFILGAEYLSRGLDRLYRQFPAIRYRSGCDLPLSHLAYADDIIIFANGGTREMNNLMDFLHHYENCSGQLVNAFKSVIILPPRCSARTRSRLLRITGFGEGFFLSNTSEFLCFMVVQPPLAVMERLENVFNGFLWGSRPLDKKWHWARWSRACLPVSEGGLGFRRLKDIVESFSIKLWFRFRQGSSLWSKFMMRKYCQLGHPACVSSAGFISPTWRRLLKIRPRAESGIRWRVGMGDVNFWDDIWCGDVPLSSQLPVRGDRGVRVSHFISDGVWDFDFLCSVVPPSVAETIALIPIALGEPDLAIWVHSSDGVFSIKSAWELVRLRDQVSDIFTPCWGSWLRPTMSFFLWRFWHQWLPVDDVLQRRGFELASKCQCCEMPETFTHIFIDSPIARSVWHFFGAVFHVRIPLTSDFRLFLSAWKRHPGWTPRGHVKEFLPFIVLWFLWTARNDAKHRHLHISGETVKSQILSYLRLAHAASTVKPMHWRGVLHAARSLGFFVDMRRVHKMAIVRWLRPPVGCFKLNVDGSSRGSPGASTIGGVVRDSSGQVLVSFSEFIGVGTNIRAELWAIWRGLLISSDLHLFPLWIETDSRISLLLLRSRRCTWGLEHIVTRILLLMRGRSVHLSHIYREGNSVADALAARAHTFRQYTLELGPSLPPDISIFARSDRSGLPYLRNRSS
ncbi:uncharacterized protein [Primulina eburnea]|uniref:uncharacterized protein n=1 Tax=Primulina eburnea TaxID=1245227 RepID=UPI003C6C5252